MSACSTASETDANPHLICRPAVLFLAFVIDAAFALAIVGFLVMHCRMIAKNLTTIEMYEKRRGTSGPWIFDRGPKQNFLEIFGRKYVQRDLTQNCMQSSSTCTWGLIVVLFLLVMAYIYAVLSLFLAFKHSVCIEHTHACVTSI